MPSTIQQVLRRNPIAYGIVFAVLPLILGLVVGPLVGFGPCGANVPSSVRLVVITAGALALTSPLVSSWLFLISFRSGTRLNTFLALPFLGLGAVVCVAWILVLASAIHS